MKCNLKKCLKKESTVKQLKRDRIPNKPVCCGCFESKLGIGEKLFNFSLFYYTLWLMILLTKQNTSVIIALRLYVFVFFPFPCFIFDLMPITISPTPRQKFLLIKWKRFFFAMIVCVGVRERNSTNISEFANQKKKKKNQTHPFWCDLWFFILYFDDFIQSHTFLFVPLSFHYT